MSERLSDPPLTIKEAAEAMKVGRDRVYDLVSAGELPSFRIGNKILILTSEVEALLKRMNEEFKRARRSGEKAGRELAA